MKPKIKVSPTDKKPRTQDQEERREARRKTWMRVAAIIVAIAFLAGECATLLPIE
jgi:hypothetical protein